MNDFSNDIGPLDVAYRGDFKSFTEAQTKSTGYNAAVIVERTRTAILKVIKGEARYERDSVTFDDGLLPYPLLALLLRAATENHDILSVLDFGGSLGSTYFQCRDFLSSLPRLEWSIIEQPAHVQCGQAEFSNDSLKFYDSIEACLAVRKPNVLLLSSVLQYLPQPWAFLRKAAQYSFDWIIIDRTPVIDGPDDRLTVEIVSPRIYDASYPAWFLSRDKLLACMPTECEMAVEFDALDRQLLDGNELVFKGFAFKHRR